LQSARVRTGDFVIADISLTNRSPTPLWVNGRLMVNREDDPPQVRNVWILVVGPERKDVPYECMRQTRPVVAEDYRVLMPRETISDSEMLSECYRLRRPGHYTVAAFFQDQNPERPAPPSHASSIPELVQSKPVELEILP
jgi:hypothetical protein